LTTTELHIETKIDIENILTESNLTPLISAENDYDNRDVSIDCILTDRYKIYLSDNDYKHFFELVDSGDIICDINLDINRKIVGIRNEWEEIQKYTEEYILDNLDQDYKFLRIKTLDNLPQSLFEEHPDLFNWDNISWLKLTIDFMKRNKDRLNWKILTPLIYDNPEFEKYLIMEGKLFGLDIFKGINRDYSIKSLLGEI
jgi:hypothetical protein